MVGLERGTVSLELYDPTWPDVYEQEVTRLRAVSAIDEHVPAFEHVGSTAIEGLAAKPIVDLLAVVDSTVDVEELVPIFEARGYEHRPNDPVGDRVFLTKGPPANRTHYLSVCEAGSDTHREQVAFRDYLRANPGVTTEYATLKGDLASEYADDRASYTEAKSEFVTEVLERAMDET